MRCVEAIDYTAPLSSPLETQALRAPDDGDWRVVIFHGAPGNKYLYTRFLRMAPAGVEVVLPMRPGYGKGHRSAVTEFDEQIAAIKPFLGDKKVVVMGVSYGGALAVKAALDRPDEIHGVVTVAALIKEPLDYALAIEKFGKAPGVDALTPNRWRKVLAEIEGRRAQIAPLLARARDLSAPIEILHGDFDLLVPKSDAQALMHALGPNPNAHLEIIRGGTHYLELQFPERLHRAIRRVMARAAV